MARQSTPVNNY